MLSNGTSARSEETEPLLGQPSGVTVSNESRQPRDRIFAAGSIICGKTIQVAKFLVPTFLRPRKTDPRNETCNTNPVAVSNKHHSTAYLDGVRGFASVIVFNFHWIHIFYPSSNWGYGNEDNTSLWLLPFVRIIFSGAAMVSVFFVISGFVLTHRYVRRMHVKEYDALYSSLTSLAFRRAFRLFLPSLISAIIMYILTSLNLIEQPEMVHDKPFTHGPKAFLEFLDLHSNPLSWHYEITPVYNAALWSIGVEYRGSMVIFLVVLTLARCATRVRILIEFLSMIYAFGHRRWDVSLFLAGMLTAEIDVLVSISPPSRRAFVRRKSFRALMTLTFLIGIYLSGYPSRNPTETPGYDFTKPLWPYSNYRRRLWLAVAAICIVLPIQFLGSLRAFFTSTPAKYFGSVSFALYLVHGMSNHVIGVWLADIVGGLLGGHADGDRSAVHGAAGKHLSPLGFALTTLLHFPITFWIADVFWRAVDVPSTEFARWLEGKCLA